MNEIHTTLTQIGLSSKESLTYLALLELGESSAYTVSKKSDIKKPTTYVILESLREKDLVIKRPGPHRTTYIAKDPEKLLEIAEENLIKTKNIVSNLKALNKKVEKEVKTLFFEGKKELNDALNYRFKDMENKEMVGFYAHVSNNSNINQIMPTIEKYAKNLLKYNVYTRGFAPGHKSLTKYRKEDQKYNREIKKIPFKDYSSEISIEVADSFVRIIDLVEFQAVIIDNPRIAKTIKEIFEMVWKNN